MHIIIITIIKELFTRPVICLNAIKESEDQPDIIISCMVKSSRQRVKRSTIRSNELTMNTISKKKKVIVTRYSSVYLFTSYISSEQAAFLHGSV